MMPAAGHVPKIRQSRSSVSTHQSKRSLSGVFFTSMILALGVTAIAWVGMTIHYNGLREEAQVKLKDHERWEPLRVERDDTDHDCESAKYREEAGELLKEVSRFEVGKVTAFRAAPSEQRARELSRTLGTFDRSTQTFLEAYPCNRAGRLRRDEIPNRFPTEVLVEAIGVQSWNDREVASSLRKSLWIGRDIQSGGGLYEFVEGARVMDHAYRYLEHRLVAGDLDRELDAYIDDFRRLTVYEDSAVMHWKAGAFVVLEDLIGVDWEETPPTPIRARQILGALDEVTGQLDGISEEWVQNPYKERVQFLATWNSQVEQSHWDRKLLNLSEMAIRADTISTQAHARGRGMLIAAALRRYRRNRGGCPAALNGLVSAKILEEVPLDPIAGKPFAYDRNECSVTSEAPEKGMPVVVRAISK